VAAGEKAYREQASAKKSDMGDGHREKVQRQGHSQGEGTEQKKTPTKQKKKKKDYSLSVCDKSVQPG